MAHAKVVSTAISLSGLHLSNPLEIGSDQGLKFRSVKADVIKKSEPCLSEHFKRRVKNSISQ